MIIDAHVHLRHGDRLRTEYTPDDIVRVMDALDIAKSVVFAICCTTRRSIEFAAAARQAFPDRLIHTYTPSPTAANQFSSPCGIR